MNVPFVDLHAQYLAHRAEIDRAIHDVIAETAFIGGKFVRAFEEQFARSYGVKHCVAVANGTDAIFILAKMLGLGSGDEVITTACSWIATSEAISLTGATAVFVDVDEHYNLDPELVAAAITSRTRAVFPVHLYGQAARMDSLVSLCERRGLILIEDCAQAHFAEYGGKRVGTFGRGGTFSFYPGKNLGAYGDAGAIITDDDTLARQLRVFANHGALKKHEHEMEGVNSRLDGLQAAILSAKLPHLAQWTARRREVAARYDAGLAGIPQLVTPRIAPGASHVFHLYVVQVERREQLQEFLRERGIETAIHYPTPLPFLDAYRSRRFSRDAFPRSSANQARILSLPMYAEITLEMIDHVISTIREFYRA